MVFPLLATGSPMEPESPGSPPWLGLSTFSPTLRLDAAALSSTTYCVTRARHTGSPERNREALQPRGMRGFFLAECG